MPNEQSGQGKCLFLMEKNKNKVFTFQVAFIFRFILKYSIFANHTLGFRNFPIIDNPWD